MNILVVYDGIIKDERFNVLKYAMSNEYNHIHRYLPMDMIDRDDIELWGFIFSSPVENVMEYCLMLNSIEDPEVHKEVFSAYKSIYSKKDLFMNSETLVIGESLSQLAANPKVDNVYVYSSFNDNRIVEDIVSSYSNIDRLHFCYGDFNKVVQDIPNLGLCIVPHYNHVKVIKEIVSDSPIDILLADYMYNYQSDKNNVPYISVDGVDIVDYLKDTNINLNLFKPIKEYDYNFLIKE